MKDAQGKSLLRMQDMTSRLKNLLLCFVSNNVCQCTSINKVRKTCLTKLDDLINQDSKLEITISTQGLYPGQLTYHSN